MGHHPKGVNPVVGSRMWRVCCQERRRGALRFMDEGYVRLKGYGRWKGYVRCSGKVTYGAVEGLRSPGVCGSMRHWCTRTCKGGYRSPLCNPRSRPTTSPLRGALASISSLQVGRDTASCLSRPQPHIPVGLTWLVNYASAMLMPDQSHHCYYSERFSKSALLPWRGFHTSRVSPGRGFV